MSGGKWGRLLVIAAFAGTTGFLATIFILYPEHLGHDARLYAEASRLWLEGMDPWTTPIAQCNGCYYGSTPPTLLLYAPFAYAPPAFTATVWIVGQTALVTFALRRTHLPLWWLVFPPVSSAILGGNPDALVLVALLTGPRWLAPLAKVYGGLPLLAERRWRDIGIAAAICAASLLVLPWLTFLRDFGFISGRLAAQNWNLSAWGIWPLWVAAGVALLSLGPRRAAYLAVPAIWPSTQIHYAAMSVPMLTTPLLAIGFALPLPGAAAVSVIAYAAWGRLDGRANVPVIAWWTRTRRRPTHTA